MSNSPPAPSSPRSDGWKVLVFLGCVILFADLTATRLLSTKNDSQFISVAPAPPAPVREPVEPRPAIAPPPRPVNDER